MHGFSCCGSCIEFCFCCDKMRIVIPGNPISKDRHKCGCKKGFKPKPYAYDPQVAEEMSVVKRLMLSEFTSITNSDTRQIAIEAFNLTKAKSFNVQCVFGFMPARSLNVGLTNKFLWGFDNHYSKPDLDNLLKLYFDCGTGMIWSDDAKITKQSSTKIYVENPFVEINVVANKEINVPYEVQEIMLNISPNQLTELVEDAKELATIPAKEIEHSLQTFVGLDHGATLPACARMLKQFALKHSKILSKIARE